VKPARSAMMIGRRVPDHEDAEAPEYWHFISQTVETVAARHPELDTDSLRRVMELLTAADALRYDLKSDLREASGIAAPPLNLMSALDIEGEMTLARAASLSNMSRAAASALLERLVSAGFAVRRSSPTDRRSILIDLTAAGRESVQRSRAHYNAREREWMSALTEQERDTLSELIGKLMRRHFADENGHARG
jgi:DNA-binding MarR family transcriptional regulator